jgi:hypothetical protein
MSESDQNEDGNFEDNLARKFLIIFLVSGLSL